MTLRVYLDEAGCKRRQLDIQTIRQYLLSNGHALVDNPAEADRIVVSTCAFKEKEEDDAVRRLRFFRKFGRDILVFGCLPDIASERYREFADLHKVAPREIETIDRYFEHDIVNFAGMPQANLLGRRRFGVVRALRRKLQGGEVFGRETLAETARAGLDRVRELLSTPQESWFLFVCRGCQGKCSYCAIRRSVGTVKSKPVAALLAELRAGLQAGYRDFSILGDDPGCYGLDCNESLPVLLRALQEKVDAFSRQEREGGEIAFHLKEIHPKFLIPYATELAASAQARLLRSVLCPIQSGSDRILELMQREHRCADLERALARIRLAQPQVQLDTQMIVGFPGESDNEFAATLEAVRRTRFNSVVVFPYHDKEGTVASGIPEKVAAATIRKRMRGAFSYFRREGIRAYYSCP